MVKMTRGSSSSQASSVASVLASRNQGYNLMIEALGNLAETPYLAGQAYDSAKGYATSIMVPIYQLAILYNEALTKESQNLLTQYDAQVKAEDLDEDTLREKITACQNIINNYAAARELASDSGLRSDFSSKIQENQSLKAGYEDDLEKLLAYDGASASLFSESEGLLSSLDSAKAQMMTDIQNFSANGQTFVSGFSDMTWATQVQERWNARDANIQRLVEKYYNGEVLTDEEKALIQTIVSGTAEGELTRTISSTDDGQHYSEVTVTVSYAPEGKYAYTQSGNDKGDDNRGVKVNNSVGNTSGSYGLDKDGLDTSSKTTTFGDNSVGTSSHVGTDGQLGLAFTIGLAGGATVTAGIKNRKGRNYIYAKKTEEADLVSDTSVSVTHEEGTVYDKTWPKGETVKVFNQTFDSVSGVSADETIRSTSPQSRAIQQGIDSLWNGLQKAGAVSAQATGSYLANSAKISNEILNFAVKEILPPTFFVAGVAAIVVGSALLLGISFSAAAPLAVVIGLGSLVVSTLEGDKNA